MGSSRRKPAVWSRALFTRHKIKVFLYSQQVTDSLTGSFIALAQVREPSNGYLLAEIALVHASGLNTLCVVPSRDADHPPVNGQRGHPRGEGQR
jgi:hypothetical protein